MAEATTTTRQPARCQKHAFAPRDSWRPKNDVTPDVTLPAHRHQTCLGRARLASETTETGDDPVNESDPTGDITCGSIIPVGCGVATDVQNGVSGAAQAVGSFVYRYSGDIATVSSILAAVTIEIPGVGEVFGAVAIAAGALSTERELVVEHNLAAALLDAAGTIAGGGSLGAEGLASLLDQASHDATTLGPVADWLAQDAASKDALSNFLSRYGAALAAGSFSLNQLIQLISKSNSTAGASTVANNCGY